MTAESVACHYLTFQSTQSPCKEWNCAGFRLYVQTAPVAQSGTEQASEQSFTHMVTVIAAAKSSVLAIGEGGDTSGCPP